MVLENSNNVKWSANASTVKTFNSCTSQPDACQQLVVQTSMDNVEKSNPGKGNHPYRYIPKLRLSVACGRIRD